MTKMKVLVFLALVAITNANKISPLQHSPYGYIQNVAIPLAEEIYEAELNPSTRIVGGKYAQIGQFPYQVGYITTFQRNARFGVCGGSLLSSRVIVSAAHCWFDGFNQGIKMTVVLGSVTLFTGGTRLRTSNVVTHPQWNPNLYRNDVSIIILSRPVTFSSTISPISLPSGAELNQNFVGDKAVVSDFGLRTTNGRIANALSFIELNIIANAVCRLSYPFNLYSTNICTGGIDGIGTYRVDSGNPLVVTRNYKPILVGITSFGSSSAYGGMPTVYARVTSYISFVNQFL